MRSIAGICGDPKWHDACSSSIPFVTSQRKLQQNMNLFSAFRTKVAAPSASSSGLRVRTKIQAGKYAVAVIEEEGGQLKWFFAEQPGG